MVILTLLFDNLALVTGECIFCVLLTFLRLSGTEDIAAFFRNAYVFTLFIYIELTSVTEVPFIVWSSAM